MHKLGSNPKDLRAFMFPVHQKGAQIRSHVWTERVAVKTIFLGWKQLSRWSCACVLLSTPHTVCIWLLRLM